MFTLGNVGTVRVLLRPFGLALLASTLVESCGFYGTLAQPQAGATDAAASGIVLLTGAVSTLLVFGMTWLIAGLVLRSRPPAGRRLGRLALAVVLGPAGAAGAVWLWARTFQAHFSVGQQSTVGALERFGFGFIGGALHGLDFAVLGFGWGLILAALLVPPRAAPTTG